MNNEFVKRLLFQLNKKDWTLKDLSQNSKIPLRTLKRIIDSKTIKIKIRIIRTIAITMEISAFDLLGF